MSERKEFTPPKYNLKQLRADIHAAEQGQHLPYAWAKFKDWATILTLLYSVRAQHRGRVHMTAVSESTWSRYAGSGYAQVKLRTKGAMPVFQWTVAHQEQFIAAALETYALPTPTPITAVG